MWYVIQVMACHESEMVNKCRRIALDNEEVFTFFTERMERRNGEWQPKRFVTFQKYIFVDTTDPDDFRTRLHEVAGITKMLGVGDTIVPIKSEEEQFLRYIGGEEHVIGKSTVYYEGEKIVVTSGPLEGMEGRVKWLDKRQKLIGVSTDVDGKETVIKLAAEFVRRG